MCCLPSVDVLQILDGGSTPEVEDVLAHAPVARSIPLSLRNVRELVFDHGALAEFRAPRASSNELAQPVLDLLVVGDRDGPPAAFLRACALGTLWTAVTDLRVELDHGAERERLHLPGGALDRPVTHVEVEDRLRKHLAVARPPGLAYDAAAPGKNVVDERTVDEGSVDGELADHESLPYDVGRQMGHGFLLGTIRRCDIAGPHEGVVDACGEMVHGV